MKQIIVTGGAGFIGSALIRHLVGEKKAEVLNLDKLTYAGNSSSLRCIDTSPLYHFIPGDICDAKTVERAFHDFKPDSIMHLAAESHVDRSIDGLVKTVQWYLDNAWWWQPIREKKYAGRRLGTAK